MLAGRQGREGTEMMMPEEKRLFKDSFFLPSSMVEKIIKD